MPNQDTVNLLTECNSGSKMAVDAIDQIMPHARSNRLKNILQQNKTRHEALGNSLHTQLAEAGQLPQDPPVMAKAMSHLQSGVKLAMDPTDHQVASLLVDGCNMGVKSVSGYLNQYPAASGEARHTAEELVGIEQQLADQLKSFL